MTHPLPPGHPRHRFPAPEAEPASQRWQCAVCLSDHKAWEAANRDALDDAGTESARHPGIPLAAFLPEHVRESWPDIYDAATIDTVPGRGTCAVCARHVPAAST